MNIVFLQDVGDYKKDDVVELEDAVAQAYMDSGVADEADGETDPSDEQAPADEGKSQDDEVAKAVSQITKHIDRKFQVALGSRKSSAVKLPAQVKEKYNGIKSLGEFCQIIGKAAKNDWNAAQKLRTFQKAPTGANETTASEGGYLVPQEWSTDLYEKMSNELFLLDFCDVTSTKRLVHNFPIVNDTSRATGSRPVRYYAIGEGNNFTASKPVWGNVQTSLTKFGVLTYVTSEELYDNAYGLEQRLSKFATSELRFAFNDQIINGDGNSPNQTGVLSSTCLVTVAKESGQSAGTVDFRNIAKMTGRLHAGSRAKAKWLVNQEVLPQLIRMSFDPAANDKSSAYGLTFDARDEYKYRLAGMPVIECEQCAALGNVGDILLVDFSAMGVAYHDIDIAVSPHINFVNDEVAYRFSVRFATKPLWTAALTPFKGAATQSPFIALESRGTA